MPLLGTRLIPRTWSAHHAAILPGSFNAEVAVSRRAGTAYDPTTDDTTSSWDLLYSGEARVQRLVGEHPVELAGEALTGQPYLVEVDWACPAVDPGVRVRVAAAPNDPSLIDQDLWVVVAPMGSERFTRSLFCSDAQRDAPVVTTST